MDNRIGPINDLHFVKADGFAQNVYKITYTFPHDELFGITSQLRRAVLSIPLNITEGYARNSFQDQRRFLEIAYGSLKEVKYLLYFCLTQKIIQNSKFEELITQSDELGKMMWVKIRTLREKSGNK